MKPSGPRAGAQPFPRAMRSKPAAGAEGRLMRKRRGEGGFDDALELALVHPPPQRAHVCLLRPARVEGLEPPAGKKAGSRGAVADPAPSPAAATPAPAAAADRVTPADAAPPTCLAPEIGPARPAAKAEASVALLQLALDDRTLHIDAHPARVHLAVDTEALGPLILDVRLDGGRAHVRFDGAAAPLLSHRGPELAAVLQKEGLGLGNFTRGEPQQRDDAPGAGSDDAPLPSPAPAASPVKPPAPGPRHEGRIDIEA